MLKSLKKILLCAKKISLHITPTDEKNKKLKPNARVWIIGEFLLYWFALYANRRVRWSKGQMLWVSLLDLERLIISPYVMTYFTLKDYLSVVWQSNLLHNDDRRKESEGGANEQMIEKGREGFVGFFFFFVF